jgi:hypothetical protein
VFVTARIDFQFILVEFCKKKKKKETSKIKKDIETYRINNVNGLTRGLALPSPVTSDKEALNSWV